MRYLLAIFLLVSPAQAETITRYYFRTHVFYDDGLKMFESEATWRTLEKCEEAGEKDVAHYNRRFMANFVCEPVHYILDLGGKYT